MFNGLRRESPVTQSNFPELETKDCRYSDSAQIWFSHSWTGWMPQGLKRCVHYVGQTGVPFRCYYFINYNSLLGWICIFFPGFKLLYPEVCNSALALHDCVRVLPSPILLGAIWILLVLLSSPISKRGAAGPTYGSLASAVLLAKSRTLKIVANSLSSSPHLLIKLPSPSLKHRNISSVLSS